MLEPSNLEKSKFFLLRSVPTLSPRFQFLSKYPSSSVPSNFFFLLSAEYGLIPESHFFKSANRPLSFCPAFFQPDLKLLPFLRASIPPDNFLAVLPIILPASGTLPNFFAKLREPFPSPSFIPVIVSINFGKSLTNNNVPNMINTNTNGLFHFLSGSTTLNIPFPIIDIIKIAKYI